MGGGIPLRLGTPLGGPSAGAGGQPGGNGNSFRCGPHFSAMGGGHWGNCGNMPWAAREGGGPFWVSLAAVQGRCFGIHSAGDDRGGADCGGHGLDPPPPLPRSTGDLPKAEEARDSNFTFSPGCCERRRERGGGSRVGGPWWHSCACHGLLFSGLVRPHPSGWRIFGGRKLLGYGPPGGGSLDGDGAVGLNGQGRGVNTYGSTRRDGMGTSWWSQEDPRFLKALWRVSFKGRSGRMGGGMVTGGGGLRLHGRVDRQRFGFFRGGVGRISVRPWPMPRTSRARGC